MTDPEEPDLVQIRNVSFAYPSGRQALSDVSLDLSEGSVTTLIGPSGCGKSTLLRIVAGLQEPSSGRVVRRENISTRDIGFVFQDPTLMPWADVFDNVWLPLRFRGQSRAEARQAVLAVLDTVGLADTSELRPHQLSGGMRMRVSIARAMVTRPRLLLMDEPFAALDETTRFTLNDEVLDLASHEGLTVLFVTHSVYEAVYLSDRVAVMSSAPGSIAATNDMPPRTERGETYRDSEIYLHATAQLAAAVRQESERAPKVVSQATARPA